MVVEKTRSLTVISKDALAQRRESLCSALPTTIRQQQYWRGVELAVLANNKVRRCTETSVMTAIAQAIGLGLDLSPVSGEAYLVPHKDQCTLIVGYRGLIALAMRSGKISLVESRVVYECDEFAYSYGLHPDITHTPATDRPTTAAPTHVYAVARMSSGESAYDVMSIPDVERIRSRSSAAEAGPWQTDYVAMAKKTVVRRLLKMLPVSQDITEALAIEDAPVQPTTSALDIAYEMEVRDEDHA